MATATKVSSMTFPFPMGILQPTSDAACIPLTTNILPVQEVGVTEVVTGWNQIEIRALSDNTGQIFICNSAAAPDTANYLNVIDILQPGEAWPRGHDWANTVDIRYLFIGVETGNAAHDAVIANISQF